jgi:ABC-2 type transport system permease protein
MTPRGLSATAVRVLAQLRRDPRTVALVFLVPCLLLALLKYLFDDQPETFDRIGVPLVGLFPFLQLFIVTSVTMLRERSSGTLERLMASPIAKLDLLAGYGAAFALLAALQATIVASFALTALGLDTSANPPTVVALAVANALLGMSLGLLASAFARTEFQAVQFMPAFILPQLLLCGLFVPRERMAGALEALADALPATYAYDALDKLADDGALGARGTADVAVILGLTALALILSAATLRRRTA